MITPTIGRIVHYYHGGVVDEEPQAAIVAYVHTDRMVNLAVVNHSGFVEGHTSILLVQPEDDGVSGPYCRWMPYQVKKAMGSESGEKAAGVESV